MDASDFFFFLFKGDFLDFFFLCTIVSCIATKNIQVQKQILQMALNTFSGHSLPNHWLKNPVFQIPTPFLNFFLTDIMSK